MQRKSCCERVSTEDLRAEVCESDGFLDLISVAVEEMPSSRWFNLGESMFKFRHVRTIAVLAALLAAGSALSSCYGSFGLTKKVYQFNGKLGDKWINSLFVFLIGGPVYGLAGTADVVIFNLIEFWTGSNPVASNDAKSFDQKMADGTRVQGQKLSDGRLEVKLTPAQGESKVVVLDQQIDGIKATSTDGEFVAKVASAADGRTLLITPKAN